MTPTASTVSERPSIPRPVVTPGAFTGAEETRAPDQRRAVVPGRSPVAPASPIAARGRDIAARGRDIAGVVRAYVALTKPRIVELLLVTTAPTMLLGYGGLPPLWLVAVVLIGGSLAAGAANALNCYIDRDIDQVMRPT